MSFAVTDDGQGLVISRPKTPQAGPTFIFASGYFVVLDIWHPLIIGKAALAVPLCPPAVRQPQAATHPPLN
jgi:hypothetical protein